MNHPNPDNFVFEIRPQRGVRTAFRKYRIAGKDYIGAHGNESYALSLRNNSSRRAAVRLTIDGTDVISGKPADLAYGTGLWIVEPHAVCELEAWPESNSGGGRFVFTQTGNTVAAHTHGDVSHLGILGAAVFIETAERIDFGAGGLLSARGGGYDREIHTMGMKGLDEPLMRGGPTRSAAGTGVGSYVKQDIRKAEGLEKPRLLCVKQIYYVWWDDLQAMLRKAEPPELEYVPGFPAAARETFQGIDLRGVPRIETDDPRFATA